MCKFAVVLSMLISVDQEFTYFCYVEIKFKLQSVLHVDGFHPHFRMDNIKSGG